MKNDNSVTNKAGEAAHTPLPWINTFSGFLNGAEYVIGLTDQKGHEWARIVQSSIGKGGDELEANAAFIVRACNSHAALVEALADALNYVDYVADCGNGGAEKCGDKLRAALSFAKGGTP